MTDQPTSAPTDLPKREDARDDAAPAAALRRTGDEESPGGGGLGGDDAGSGAAAEVGGASPNAPSPDALPDAAGEAGAGREARLRSTDEIAR